MVVEYTNRKKYTNRSIPIGRIFVGFGVHAQGCSWVWSITKCIIGGLVDWDHVHMGHMQIMGC